MTDWKEQEKLADEILDINYRCVYVNKYGTRNGATVSILKRAIERGKTICLVEPYHNTIKQTIIERVLPMVDLNNDDVGYLKSVEEMCPQHIDLAHIPFSFKNRCKQGKDRKCISYENCPYQEFLLHNYKLILTTYPKLNILTRGKYTDPDDILEKIKECDIIFFDEYSHAININAPQVDIKILQSIIDKVMEKSEVLPDNITMLIGYLQSIIKFMEFLPEKVNISTFKKISRLIKDLNLNKIERETLLEAVNLLEHEKFHKITLKRKINNGRDVEYIEYDAIVPDIIHPMLILDKALQDYNGKIIITDALLPSTKIIEGHHVKWPDFKKTQERQLIVCDTRQSPLARYVSNLSIYGKEYQTEMKRLKSFLANMCSRFGAENFLIFWLCPIFG